MWWSKRLCPHRVEDHFSRSPVLDTTPRVLVFTFTINVAPGSLGHASQLDERRVAHEASKILTNDILFTPDMDGMQTQFTTWKVLSLLTAREGKLLQRIEENVRTSPLNRCMLRGKKGLK